jgi:hypothetical protein
MLEYHHLYDPNHCSFRILQFLLQSEASTIEIDKVKIFDLYYLFPILLSDVVLPKQHLQLKPLIKSMPLQYENIPNPVLLFSILEEIQNSVISHFAVNNILDANELADGLIKLNIKNVPSELIEFINKHRYSKEEWFNMLIKLIIEMPLSGLKGLKQRSGLKEYRYE